MLHSTHAAHQSFFDAHCAERVRLDWVTTNKAASSSNMGWVTSMSPRAASWKMVWAAAQRISSSLPERKLVTIYAHSFHLHPHFSSPLGFGPCRSCTMVGTSPHVKALCSTTLDLDKDCVQGAGQSLFDQIGPKVLDHSFSHRKLQTMEVPMEVPMASPHSPPPPPHEERRRPTRFDLRPNVGACFGPPPLPTPFRVTGSRVGQVPCFEGFVSAVPCSVHISDKRKSCADCNRRTALLTSLSTEDFRTLPQPRPLRRFHRQGQCRR